MYAYREYLTLAEAAEMLGTDVTAIVDQNCKPGMLCKLPRIGIKTLENGLFTNHVAFDAKLQELIEHRCDEDEFYCMFGYLPNVNQWSNRTFVYLNNETVNQINQNGIVSLGGFKDRVGFAEIHDSFLSDSIEVEIPQSFIDLEPSGNTFFDTYHCELVELISSSLKTRYTAPEVVSLSLDSLYMLYSDVVSFCDDYQSLQQRLQNAEGYSQWLLSELQKYGSSGYESEDVNDEKQQLIDDLTNRINKMESEKKLLNQSNESLRSTLKDIDDIFDPEMREVLFPIANVIKSFENSECFEKCQVNPQYRSLGMYRQWVQENSVYSYDKKSYLFGKLLLQYYESKY
jgi:hypothetical protein